MGCRFGLQRYLPSPEAAEQYITSCIAYVPLSIALQPLYDTPRTRYETLLAVMAALRAQHRAWLANPALPFVHVLDPLSPQLNPNLFVPDITHLGVFENWFLEVVEGKEGRRIEVQDIKYRIRLVNATRPYVHAIRLRVWWEADSIYRTCSVWSFKGLMHWGVQVRLLRPVR
jgi:hypothetical protein